jgi:hypothetical protein
VAILFAKGDAKAKAALKDYVDQELQRLATSSETYDLSSSAHLSLAAMLALRNGNHALAEKVLKALQPKAEGSRYFSLEQPYRIAACEERIERDAPAAVGCLEALLSERAYYQTRVALLRAYGAAGDDAKALATAHWLIEHRGQATTEWLGEFAARAINLLSWDEALVQAAALERKAGNGETAQALLARFRSTWSAPEGDPPLLSRVRDLSASGAENEKH